MMEMPNKEGPLQQWQNRNDIQELINNAYQDSILRKPSYDYKRLLVRFTEWKTLRQNLVTVLKKSLNNLERCVLLTSGFRILSSLLNILSVKVNLQENSTLAAVTEFVYVLDLTAFAIEIGLCLKIEKDLEKAIKDDNESFKNITLWFDDSQELKEKFRSSLHPAINEDKLEKIKTSFISVTYITKRFTSLHSIFMSKDLGYFTKNNELDVEKYNAALQDTKIKCFKILVDRDPCDTFNLNSSLKNQMEELKKRKKDVSDIMKNLENKETDENKKVSEHLDSILTDSVKNSVGLNSIVIFANLLNFLTETYRPEEMNNLMNSMDRLLKDTKKELRDVQSLAINLRPPGSEIDPVLKESEIQI